MNFLMGQTNSRSKWHRVVQVAAEPDRAACSGLRPREPYKEIPGPSQMAARLIALRNGMDLCQRCWPVLGRVTPKVAADVAAETGGSMPETYFELHPLFTVKELGALAEHLGVSDEVLFAQFKEWRAAQDASSGDV